MSKKILALSVLFALMLASFVQTARAPNVSIPAQNHIIVESIGDPETVDPAWAYDTASGGLIYNVYEALVAFSGESVETFEPWLATEWLINQPPSTTADIDTGHIAPVGTDSTWYFKLDTDAMFQPWKGPNDVWHVSRQVTTADVKYSFQRAMIQDRSGGPIWMMNEPLFGYGWPDKTVWPADNTNPISDAVQRNSTHVWFNLVMPYKPFMAILAQTWSSVINMDFAEAYGDWPHGDWANFLNYLDPAQSPLDAAGNVMCGSGPFMLDYWSHGVEWSIKSWTAANSNDGSTYWRGFPGKDLTHGDNIDSRWADRVTEKVVYEWGTRLADFRAGTADLVYVPRQYKSEVEGWQGIRGMKDLESLVLDAQFYNFDINPATTYAGSKLLNGNGIPLDFFANKNVRLAFTYAFNFTKFLAEAWLGEASQPPSPVIRGLAYAGYVWDGGTITEAGIHHGETLAPIPMYNIDLTKTKSYFQAALFDHDDNAGTPDVSVWDQGFRMTITYNSGNVPRFVAAQMLKENIEGLNSQRVGKNPFVIVVTPVTWSTYLGEIWFRPTYQSTMPLYVIGWLADFPDPHNFVTPFMFSEGDFAFPQRYHNATVDALIADGIASTDESERAYIYHRLSLMYYQDNPGIGHDQALGRHWERDWVQGWYFNPIVPDNYFYHMWKGLDGDINGDNTVGVADSGSLSNYWFVTIEYNATRDPQRLPLANPDIGPAGYYNRISDLNPSNMYVAKWLGSTEGALGSIGQVDIYDAGLINGNWLKTVV